MAWQASWHGGGRRRPRELETNVIACGLDFGTSNSAVALTDGTVLPISPVTPEPRLFRSVIFFPENRLETYAGEEAITHYLEDGSGRFIQSVKSFLHRSSFETTKIRGRSWTIEELVAILLGRVRRASIPFLGRAPEAAVLGRPALFSPVPEEDALAERRLRRAAELAGFTRIEFVIEPIAAALAYEANLARDELVLVADFGAGTTDLTLMKLGPSRRGHPDRRADVVGSTGLRIGGDTIDSEIMRHRLLPYFGSKSTFTIRDISHKRLPMPNHILRKMLSWHEMSFIREKATQETLELMMETSDQPDRIEALYDLTMENFGYRLFRTIEAAKVKLSTQQEATISFNEARIHLEERITRAEFEAFCGPLMKELDQCVEQFLAQHARESEVNAVFLTGGTSQIPAIKKMLVDRFGADRVRTKDSFISVAEGLGRAAGALAGPE
jgi:hypothetical chaperone protein